MLEYMKETANRTFTENGAVTPRSTGSDVLNLFATIGALRSQNEAEIEKRFLRSFAENGELTMKMLFYARDVRGGLGERRVFRVLLRYLAENSPACLARNLRLVPEYGRWDDLLLLLNTPLHALTVSLLKEQFEADLAALKGDGEVSLLGKWLPSVNASNGDVVRTAKLLAKEFGMPEAEYRKALSALRARIRILENYLRESDYSFDYSQQPSRAMFKYRKAFLRNDGERYGEFMNKVSTGEATLHTGGLMPYDIVQSAYRAAQEERPALNATWTALENFTKDENALVVADGSGSMYSGSPTPAAVAQSLAIYFAEHNHGAFHNHFITFSDNPQLVEIKGSDIVEKVLYCRSFNEVASTNIQKVYELILKTALRHHLPQSELPSTLYIISDMEFNYCTMDASLSNFEYAKNLYAAHGYRLPAIVFWNVQSRREQQPVKMNEQGVALVSGFSPRIFSQVISGDTDPYTYMLNVLMSERYAPITA
ncbi:MAG: DUF2828 family protein [Oscillospiraceae bacterium]|nr:DUF2828 family protein [Oscillospiraceae bacterium]